MRLSDSAPFLRCWPLLGLAALFILRQGERVEARAFRQALLARIVPADPQRQAGQLWLGEVEINTVESFFASASTPWEGASGVSYIWSCNNQAAECRCASPSQAQSRFRPLPTPVMESSGDFGGNGCCHYSGSLYSRTYCRPGRTTGPRRAAREAGGGRPAGSNGRSRTGRTARRRWTARAQGIARSHGAARQARVGGFRRVCRPYGTTRSARPERPARPGGGRRRSCVLEGSSAVTPVDEDNANFASLSVGRLRRRNRRRAGVLGHAHRHADGHHQLRRRQRRLRPRLRPQDRRLPGLLGRQYRERKRSSHGQHRLWRSGRRQELHLRGEGQRRRVSCWGAFTTDNPRFTALDAGVNHVCGSRAGGEVICWGDPGDDKLAVPADTTFTAFAVGDYHTCGRKTDGAVICWGSDTDGQTQPVRVPIPP